MPDNFDITALNSGASAVVGASVARNGTLPNVQLSAEALQLGLGDQLAQLYASASPAYDHFLAHIPAGQSPTVAQKPPLQAQVAAVQPKIDPFNWDQYWKDTHSKIDSNTDGAGKWADLGEIPITDPRYVAAVVNNKNKDQVRKWQRALLARQFGYDDKGHPLEVSGLWDKNWVTQLKEFYVSQYAYDAIAAKDLNYRKSVQDFLKTYVDFDVSTLGHLDENTKAQYLWRYILSSGYGGKPRDGIKEFSDKYGADTLPTAYSKLNDSKILQLLMSPTSPYYAAKKDAKTPPELVKGLDPQQQKLLAAVIDEGQGQNPVFAALDWPLRQVERSLLTLNYMVNPMQSPDDAGQKNLMDPFNAWQHAGKYSDNFIAGALGDKFATEHTTLTAIGNFAVSTVADPVFWLPVIGPEAKLEMGALKAAGSAEEAAAAVRTTFKPTLRAGASRAMMMTPSAMRDGMARNGTMQHLLDAGLNPQVGAAREMVRVLMDPKTEPWQFARLLQEGDSEALAEIRAAKESGDPNKIAELIGKRYGHKVLDPSHHLNAAQALKAFDKGHFDRLAAGKRAALTHPAIRSSMHSGRFGTFDNLVEMQDHVNFFGKVMGVDQKTLDEAINQMTFGSPVVQASAVDRLKQAAKEAFQKANPNLDYDFLATGGRQANLLDLPLKAGVRGRGLGEERRMYLPVLDEATGQVVEGSRLAAQYKFSDPVSQGLADHLRSMMDRVPAWLEEHLGNLAGEHAQHLAGEGYTDAQHRALAESSDEFRAVQADLQQAGQDMLDMIKQLPGRTGAEGEVPVAAFSKQFGLHYDLGIDPYNVLVARSPVLSKMEWLQRRMFVDEFMNGWKMATLFSFSTALRIVVGDETSRLFIHHWNQSPAAAARYLQRKLTPRFARGEMRDLPTTLQQRLSRLYDANRDDFIHFSPDDQGYQQTVPAYLRHYVGTSAEAVPWTEGIKQSGEQGAIAYLGEWLKAGSREAQEFARRDGIDLENDAQVQAWARAQHLKFMTATKYTPSDPAGSVLFDYVDAVAHNKRANARAVKDFLRTNSGRPDLLPHVSGRRPYGPREGFMGGFNRMSSWLHEDFLGSRINNARQTGYDSLVEENLRKLRKLYPQDKFPEWTDDRIEAVAANDAMHTVKRITYQFQRSITGQTIRNVFPFWGATTSMQRFWLREAVEHPFFATAARRGVFEGSPGAPSITELKAQGPIRVPVPGTGWAMRHIGMSNGDDLTFDPTYWTFFTNDGINGFFPGPGPVAMLPVKGPFPWHDPVVNALSQVPGFQYAAIDSPFLPKVEKLATGISLLTGKGPWVTKLFGGDENRYKALVAQRFQQMEEAHLRDPQHVGEPTQAGVEREVGAETAISGAGQFAVPLHPEAGLAEHRQDTQIQTQLDQAKDDNERKQILSANSERAPLFAYRDPQLAALIDPKYAKLGLNDRRDAVAADHPWVEAYQGTVQSNVQGVSQTTEPSQQAFFRDIAAGNLSYLNVPEMLDKVHNSIALRDGYAKYNPAYDAYQQALVAYGVSASSAEGKQLKAAILTPVVNDLLKNNQPWSDHYSRITNGSTAGLEEKTARLRTLGMQEMLPFHDSLESDTSQAWRDLFTWRDQIAGQLRAAVAAGATFAEKQAYIGEFRQAVAELAKAHPGFARQIERFSYANLDDFLNLQAKDTTGQ